MGYRFDPQDWYQWPQLGERVKEQLMFYGTSIPELSELIHVEPMQLAFFLNGNFDRMYFDTGAHIATRLDDWFRYGSDSPPGTSIEPSFYSAPATVATNRTEKSTTIPSLLDRPKTADPTIGAVATTSTKTQKVTPESVEVPRSAIGGNMCRRSSPLFATKRPPAATDAADDDTQKKKTPQSPVAKIARLQSLSSSSSQVASFSGNLTEEALERINTVNAVACPNVDVSKDPVNANQLAIQLMITSSTAISKQREEALGQLESFKQETLAKQKENDRLAKVELAELRDSHEKELAEMKLKTEQLQSTVDEKSAQVEKERSRVASSHKNIKKLIEENRLMGKKHSLIIKKLKDELRQLQEIRVHEEEWMRDLPGAMMLFFKEYKKDLLAPGTFDGKTTVKTEVPESDQDHSS